MTHAFDEINDGKRVVTGDGHVVGYVSDIEEDAVYVTPQSGLLNGRGPWIGNQWLENDPYTLNTDEIDSVTEDAIVLRNRGFDLLDSPENR